jgi:aminoglycoside phosphotransferase (APT) family kinase protein
MTEPAPGAGLDPSMLLTKAEREASRRRTLGGTGVSEAVVATPAEAKRLEYGAAIVLDPLREFLDAAGLGAGELSAEEIGDGHSNLSFLLVRGERRFVLRRPPRGELSASANDVLRESRVLEAVARTPVPVPEVLARCEDPELIGAPFFVMSFVEGAPINDGLAEETDDAEAPARILTDTVAALADLHAADLDASGLGDFGRPSGYLDRQLRRFASLLEANATRPLPDLESVAAWLAANIPADSETTFVHGDYRLGNLMFASPLRLTAVLDWELATVGDPLADLGYLTAVWAEEGDTPNPMFALSRLTARPGFPGRDEVAGRYAEATGRSLESLPWYQTLALWKSAIFLEGSFKRYSEGASTDEYFAALDRGVPAVARAAAGLTEAIG